MSPVVVVLIGVLATVFMGWVAYVSKTLIETANTNGVTTTILQALATSVSEQGDRLTNVERAAAAAALSAEKARADALAEALKVRDRLEADAGQVRHDLVTDAAKVKKDLDEKGGVMILLAAAVTTILLVIVLIAALWIGAKDAAVDSAKQEDICRVTVKNWTTLHTLIEIAGKQGGTGTALDELVYGGTFPAGTDLQTIEIIRRLAGDPPDPDPQAALQPYFDALGKRPVC